MTRLILLHHPEDGINLAQGFPDFPAPQALKDAACAAIMADVNQYAVTWGAPALRQAIARKYGAATGSRSTRSGRSPSPAGRPRRWSPPCWRRRTRATR